MSTATPLFRVHYDAPASDKDIGGTPSDVFLPLVLPPMTNDDVFFQFCQENSQLQIERNALGEAVVMAPSGSETGYFNGEAFFELRLWNRDQGFPGYTFDSSAGFRLSNGAVRLPDASWVRQNRWEALTQEERERFAPLCPDFVIELLSPSDSLSVTQAKMIEYRDAGALLGWLIDRRNRRVYVYRPGQDVQELDNPATISGDPEMPGLQVPTARIF